MLNMKDSDHWTGEWSRAPLLEALERHRKEELLPLHVPAHKYGGGLPSLTRLFGAAVFRFDLNAMPGLDAHDAPTEAIAEAQTLAAALFAADSAFFLVNGTSSGIHAMVMTAIRPGDSLVLPRSSHKSAFHAMILADAVPCYLPARIDERFGVARSPSVEEVAAGLRQGSRPSAVLVTQPNYYGLGPDLEGIIECARAAGALTLVDEAHGCLSYFHDGQPGAAMRLGADMSAVSMHKYGGSLTQSALLLCRRGGVDPAEVQQVLNCIGNSSASYLLMASLDAARQQLAVRGRALANQVIDLVAYLGERLDATGLFFTLGGRLDPENNGADPAKLIINVRGTGRSGFAFDDILRREHKIQVEMSDMFILVPHFSWADSRADADRLFAALMDIGRAAPAAPALRIPTVPAIPPMALSPRAAFLAKKRPVPLEHAVGEISGEMLMAYPPGIPFLCPGEVVTREVIEHARQLKAEPTCRIAGMADPTLRTLRALSGARAGLRRTS